MLKLSVVTINFNNCEGLEKTIQSVVSQTSPNFEFIIIDGGSSDRSTDVINQYQSKINYYVSEKDKGIYDAQNKGTEASKGEFVLFLNSGDSFYSDSIVEEFVKFTEDNNFKIIYGNSQILSGNKKEILVPPQLLDLNFWYRKTLNHQAVFTKRELFAKYGTYNLNYKICADFDFLLKIYLAEPHEFKHFKYPVCTYDESGFSTFSSNYDSMLAEREDILKRHLTSTQYRAIKNNYTKSLPLKQRFLLFIYARPFLNYLFQIVFKIFKR